MFFEGNIAAPPTITVFSPDISLFIIFLSSALAGATTLAVMARAQNATADKSAIRLDMERLPMIEVTGGSPVMKANNDACPLMVRLRRRWPELREGLRWVSGINFRGVETNREAGRVVPDVVAVIAANAAALPLPLAGEGGVGVPQQTPAQVERIPPPAALFERVDLPRKRER